MLTLLLEAKGSIDYMIPLRLSPRVSSCYRFRLVVMLAWLIHVFPHTAFNHPAYPQSYCIPWLIESSVMVADDMYLTLDVMFFLILPYARPSVDSSVVISYT